MSKLKFCSRAFKPILRVLVQWLRSQMKESNLQCLEKYSPNNKLGKKTTVFRIHKYIVKLWGRYNVSSHCACSFMRLCQNKWMEAGMANLAHPEEEPHHLKVKCMASRHCRCRCASVCTLSAHLTLTWDISTVSGMLELIHSLALCNSNLILPSV